MVWFKRAFTLIALGVLIYLFLPLIGELRSAAGLFLKARWGWLLAALLIQLLSYGSLAGLNLRLLNAFQGKISFTRVLTILPTIAFIEVAVPSAGASGVALRARFLGRSGFSIEVSTFTVIMEGIYLSIAFSVVSISGFWHLLRTGELSSLQASLVAGLILLFLSVLVGGFWIGRDRSRTNRLLLRLSGPWNRFAPRLHAKPVNPETIGERLDAFYIDLANLRRLSPLPFIILAFTRVSLDIATLGLCFLAFSFVIKPGVLITGYGIMLAASGLAALPGGLGMAEASLPVIYARLGAPGAVAIAAALAYRLIAFWLVRFIGFINWQLLEART